MNKRSKIFHHTFFLFTCLIQLCLQFSLLLLAVASFLSILLFCRQWINRWNRVFAMDSQNTSPPGHWNMCRRRWSHTGFGRSFPVSFEKYIFIQIINYNFWPFRVFDQDSNGYITLDELQRAMQMIGENVTDAQLNEMLALADLDKDGKINYEGEGIFRQWFFEINFNFPFQSSQDCFCKVTSHQENSI